MIFTLQNEFSFSLRFTAWYTVQMEAQNGLNPYIPRELWNPFDPMLLSEGKKFLD